jgi:hypothetical protein
MKILALDLGKFNTMCCFFDSKTRKHEFLNATTDRNYFETIFKKHKIDLVVMEACGPSGWICGKQKTRKKKAAIALARKIAVLAWAPLRDEKDWEPKSMIEVTESYGRIPLGLQEKLLEMPKKECRHKRKNRRISEERAAKRAAAEQAAQTPKSTSQPTKSTPKRSPVRSSAASPAKRNPKTITPKGKPTKTKAKPTANPRRTRKLETAG